MTQAINEHTPPAAPPKSSHLRDATDAAMHLRDAVTALALMVRDPWDNAATADRTRNALDWIAERMDLDCDVLHDALDELAAEARS